MVFRHARRCRKSCKCRDGSGRKPLGPHAESGTAPGISGNFVWQELQGHKMLQADVFGLVDASHTPAADLLGHAVMREGLANHSGDVSLSGRFILRTRAFASQRMTARMTARA